MAENKNKKVENGQNEKDNTETLGPSFSIVGNMTFAGEDKKTQSFPIDCTVDGSMSRLIDGLEESTEKSMLIYVLFYVLKIQTAQKIRSLKTKAIEKKKSYDVKDAQKTAKDNRLTIGASNDPVKRTENVTKSFNRMSEEEQEKWMEEKGYVKVS